MTKIFIDGSAGTTGLRIHERLSSRSDIEVISIPEALRKDTQARADYIGHADISFLCLPDAAAKEVMALVDPKVRVIDTSTAHRTDPSWVYGMPELTGQKEKIRNSAWIANPGCHASGFIALAAPLVEAGILGKDAMLSCFSLTGYSGGGKSMIAQYEDENRDPLLKAPRQYGLTQMHKHLPEMAKICGLIKDPVFAPIVADFYAGMEVTIPLFASQIHGTVQDIKDAYREYYKGKIIHFDDSCDEGGFMSANAFAGRDDMQITVAGNEERILLISRFDNLGKGASGAAIQNMNLMLGLPEETGLVIEG